MRKLKIGLTGGIGSGKTTVAHILSKRHYAVYIADQAASTIMNRQATVRKALIRKFGREIYTSENKLDKKKLADLIFNCPEALQEVNRIVHPAVLADFREWCHRQNGKIVFFESAILFEAGLAPFFDYTVCIGAPLAIRIERVVKRDRTTTGKVRERIRNQMPEGEKCRLSDFILRNDNRHSLLKQIATLEKQLKKKYLWQNSVNG